MWENALYAAHIIYKLKHLRATRDTRSRDYCNASPRRPPRDYDAVLQFGDGVAANRLSVARIWSGKCIYAI